MRPVLIIPFFLFISFSCQSQEAFNNWHFGYFSAISFNGGSAIALSGGQMQTHEGCSTVSDAAGNLLFYTDGRFAYDSAHNFMPNSLYLTGSITSSQSALIVPRPGHPSLYYIFTVDELYGDDGLRYSEVDMTLRGGLGDVNSVKNVLVRTPVMEKMAGIRHCNNTDVWVVVHDTAGNMFRSYLVTAAGVDTNAVLSPVGEIFAGYYRPDIGQIKGSPDGHKIAMSTTFFNSWELFDFDNSTGIVSNPLLIPNPAPSTESAYGIEFSPDNTKLYGTVINPGKIYQWDLCAGSDSAIVNSRNLIYSTGWMFSLQLAPDNKIYVTQGNYLGCINEPNEAGSLCSFNAMQLHLLGGNSWFGLPNFVTGFSNKHESDFTWIAECLNVGFTSSEHAIQAACSSAQSELDSVTWYFDDPASAISSAGGFSVQHVFSGSGSYNVMMVLHYPCRTDTVSHLITVSNPEVIAVASHATPGMNDGAVETTCTGGSGTISYLWSNGAIVEDLSHLAPGTYFVFATDTAGCSDSATVQIDTDPDQGTTVYIPSGFSPDGDGINDSFFPVIMNARDPSLMIFSRWGEKLFESADAAGWNGTFRGNACETGAYVYVFECRENERGEPVRRTGTITLVRNR